MSLVRSLMNSELNNAYIDTSKYDCDNGALRIATESIEELHDIFMDGYIYEQAEIAAIREGVDLWDSRFQIVAESAISDGIKKLKEFFKNLWAKIKAIIKSIIMNIGAIFISAKKFVEKYKKEINAASNNLDGFEYKVYNYDDERINNLSDIESFDIDAYGQEMIERVSNSVGLNKGFVNQYMHESYYDGYDEYDYVYEARGKYAKKRANKLARETDPSSVNNGDNKILTHEEIQNLMKDVPNDTVPMSNDEILNSAYKSNDPKFNPKDETSVFLYNNKPFFDLKEVDFDRWTKLSYDFFSNHSEQIGLDSTEFNRRYPNYNAYHKDIKGELKQAKNNPEELDEFRREISELSNSDNVNNHNGNSQTFSRDLSDNTKNMINNAVKSGDGEQIFNTAFATTSASSSNVNTNAQSITHTQFSEKQTSPILNQIGAGYSPGNQYPSVRVNSGTPALRTDINSPIPGDNADVTNGALALRTASGGGGRKPPVNGTMVMSPYPDNRNNGWNINNNHSNNNSNSVMVKQNNNKRPIAPPRPKTIKEMYDLSKKLTDEDYIATLVANQLNLNVNNNIVKKKDDINDACFAAFRGGAKSKSDMDNIKISDLGRYVTAIEKSNVDKIKVYSGRVDTAYTKIIKNIDNAAKNLDSTKNDSSEDARDGISKSVEILRNCSKGISLYQGFHNTYLTEWKQVVNERDNAYKKLILAAISHSNKSKRNK